MEETKVIYTLEPHYEAGLHDNTPEEWEKLREPHDGILLSWSNESRIGSNGQNETITVGIIKDAITHEVLAIPKNRIKFV